MKSWSRSQGFVALSSGEAEYYAMVTGAAEAIGLQSLARDLGCEMTIKLWVDSSAARSMASRVGAGKVRHMDVKYFWLQERVRNRDVTVKKVLGKNNPADVLTKPKTIKEIEELASRVRVSLRRHYR